MKVAAYARVSTSDKDQDLETQLFAIRDCCAAQSWELVELYVDEASASDLRRRVSWRRMMDDAAKRKFQAVVVFKLDRAFRSVKDMHDTLSAWEAVGVSFRSVREQFDTSTAMGRLLLNGGKTGVDAALANRTRLCARAKGNPLGRGAQLASVARA